MTKYYVQLEKTVEELTDLFVEKYVEIMECDKDWAREVQKMECTNPHTKDDVERTLKMLCNLNGVAYVK
jgi:hypothetical protein